MPEPLYLKLRHIANYTPYNMTSFILERIAPEIEKEITVLTDVAETEETGNRLE